MNTSSKKHLDKDQIHDLVFSVNDIKTISTLLAIERYASYDLPRLGKSDKLELLDKLIRTINRFQNDEWTWDNLEFNEEQFCDTLQAQIIIENLEDLTKMESVTSGS